MAEWEGGAITEDQFNEVEGKGKVRREGGGGGGGGGGGRGGI